MRITLAFLARRTLLVTKILRESGDLTPIESLVIESTGVRGASYSLDIVTLSHPRAIPMTRLIHGADARGIDAALEALMNLAAHKAHQ